MRYDLTDSRRNGQCGPSVNSKLLNVDHGMPSAGFTEYDQRKQSSRAVHRDGAHAEAGVAGQNQIRIRIQIRIHVCILQNPELNWPGSVGLKPKMTKGTD